MTINQLIKELMRIQTKHGKKIRVCVNQRIPRLEEFAAVDKPAVEEDPNRKLVVVL